MHVPPALIDHALRVRADEEELFEIVVALAGHVGRARDMRLAGVAEFEFRALFLAIGAADEKHERSSFLKSGFWLRPLRDRRCWARLRARSAGCASLPRR